MIKHLSTGWERAFARNLPRVLDEFRRKTAALLTSFHQAVEDRAFEKQLGIPGLAMLSQQLKVYSTNLADVSGSVREKINSTQREASREFTPVIRAAMLVAYNYCNAERGSFRIYFLFHQMLILASYVYNYHGLTLDRSRMLR